MEITMNTTDWNELELYYGETAVRYLKNNHVVPERTSLGAYKIPNIQILKECVKLASPGDRRAIARRMANYKEKVPSSMNNAAQYVTYDVPETFRRIVNVRTKRSNKSFVRHDVNIAMVATRMTICFEDQNRERINLAEKYFSISRAKPFDKSWDYEKTINQIIVTNIGHEQMIGHQACLKDLKLILQEFRRRHFKFKYFTALETILKESNSDNNYSAEVSIHQLQKFFYQFFANVVPASLLGSSRNTKKVRAGLKQYLLASCGETISLKSFLFRMDMSSIGWLHPIKDNLTKWSMLAKTMIWLFEILHVIFRGVFHVQKDLYSARKIFMSLTRWNRAKIHYVKVQEKKGHIMKHCSNFNESKFHVPAGPMVLFSKPNGLRTIFRIRYNQSARDEGKMLRILLQQLYLQRYKHITVQDLHAAWTRYVEMKRNDPKTKVHLVSADIADAYGSIFQNKLYDIINAMINDIPGDNLTLEWFAVLKPCRPRQKKVLEYRHWFSSCGNLPIKRRSLITPVDDNQYRSTSKSKEYIRSLLQAYIFQQTFRYNGTEYVLKRGVAQGSGLSGILSEIYYAHMTAEAFGSFMKSGTLMRYVDDFLYITDQEQSAKAFMKVVKREVTGYHCRFKKPKTQTTVDSKYFESSTDIIYLGYRLNSTTMDATPFYGELHFRHQKTIQQISYRNNVETFGWRLGNFANLKLASVVLDSRINSPSAILNTAKSAAHTMARRCVVLLLKMFDRLQQHAPYIWTEIVNSVTKLAMIFIKNLFTYEGTERKIMMRRIKLTIWRSFLRVFTRYEQFRICFCQDIKSMVNKEVVIV